MHGEQFGRPAGTMWKGKPQMLERDRRAAAWKGRDDQESTKVKIRSGGKCEVRSPKRCNRPAFEVHHHIGGWKLRGRGDSALAKNKTHCCSKCHRLIEGNVLEHRGGNQYRRATS